MLVVIEQGVKLGPLGLRHTLRQAGHARNVRIGAALLFRVRHRYHARGAEQFGDVEAGKLFRGERTAPPCFQVAAQVGAVVQRQRVGLPNDARPLLRVAVLVGPFQTFVRQLPADEDFRANALLPLPFLPLLSEVHNHVADGEVGTLRDGAVVAAPACITCDYSHYFLLIVMDIPPLSKDTPGTAAPASTPALIAAMSGFRVNLQKSSG